MMFSKLLATTTALSLSLLAAAAPADVKPLTVKDGTVCKLDSDCIDASYCRQTPAQRAAGAVAGVCSPKRDLNAACYKDAGCLSNNCVASKCGALAPTGPQVKCTRKMVGSLGSLTLAEYDAATLKPAQPYLTFNKHYAKISDGSNREVLTTSGPKNKLRFEYWECPSQALGFEGGAGQIRIPSKGKNLCLTGDITYIMVCLSPKRDEVSKRLLPCGFPGKRDLGSSPLAPLYVAPCKFDDEMRSLFNQYWVVGEQVITPTPIKKRGLVPFPNDPTVPFVLFGSNLFTGYLQGVAVAAPSGKYSTWLLDTTGSNPDRSPIYLLPNSTTY